MIFGKIGKLCQLETAAPDGTGNLPLANVGTGAVVGVKTDMGVLSGVRVGIEVAASAMRVGVETERVARPSVGVGAGDGVTALHAVNVMAQSETVKKIILFSIRNS